MEGARGAGDAKSRRMEEECGVDRGEGRSETGGG